MLPVFLILLPTMHIFEVTLVLSVICVCRFVCEVRMKPVRISCQLTLVLISVFLPKLHVCADGWWCYFWQRKQMLFSGCSQLAARCFMYIATFLHLTSSYLPVTTSVWVRRAHFTVNLWWCAWERQMAEIQFSFSHKKKRETCIWPLIMWHGAADLVWGETKGVFWWDLSLGFELTSLQESIVCNRDTRGSVRPTHYPLLYPSPHRAEVSGLLHQLIQCKLVWLCFFDLLPGHILMLLYQVTDFSMFLYITRRHFQKPLVLLKPLHSSHSLFQTNSIWNEMFLHCSVVAKCTCTSPVKLL